MERLFNVYASEKRRLANDSMRSIVGEVDCSLRLESDEVRSRFDSYDSELTSSNYPYARPERMRREVFWVSFGWMMEQRELQSEAEVAERLDVLGLQYGRVEDLLILRSVFRPEPGKSIYIFAPGSVHLHTDGSRWCPALCFEESGHTRIGVGSLPGKWTRGIIFAAVKKEG